MYVYNGKLQWFDYAKDECITMVFPAGFALSDPVCAYWQWTEESKGNKKRNHFESGTINTVTKTASDKIVFPFSFYTFEGTVVTDLKFVTGRPKENRCAKGTFLAVSSSGGQTRGTFNDGYYTFKVAIPNDGRRRAVIHMRGPEGDRDSVTFDMEQTDFSQAHTKKYLGFDVVDVEMLYFNEEPKGKPGVRSDGQTALSASRFKSKFTSLVAGAAEGHDCINEGCTMTEDDDARRLYTTIGFLRLSVRSAVYNLKHGVNLTILTSSWMGEGMLDAHEPTAGCHETQFSAKHGRSIPTYTALFDDAKRFIRTQLARGLGVISDEYKGPSPNELEPVPRDKDLHTSHQDLHTSHQDLHTSHQDLHTSHQDPQLALYSGYINPDEERFLFPFAAQHGGHAGGESVRFPKDQYSHNEL
ncbi:hypothetical protein C8Q79DRAFT_1007079 [Trametes meyenii]|nr:hypothetical protein C8Q79DRAFT_1007079 [Trametes meyenii]